MKGAAAVCDAAVVVGQAEVAAAATPTGVDSPMDGERPRLVLRGTWREGPIVDCKLMVVTLLGSPASILWLMLFCLSPLDPEDSNC